MKRAPDEPSIIPCTCPNECCIHEPTDVVREGEATRFFDLVMEAVGWA